MTTIGCEKQTPKTNASEYCVYTARKIIWCSIAFHCLPVLQKSSGAMEDHANHQCWHRITIDRYMQNQSSLTVQWDAPHLFSPSKMTIIRRSSKFSHSQRYRTRQEDD